MARGTTLPQHIGKYEVLEEVGRGAMGVVFRARDPVIGRPVAVKTITTGIAEDPELWERFRREAVAAGNLQHPNIVTIYEMSDSEGIPFIAMEYLEGESLEKVINRQLQMPLAQKLGQMVQACRALDYAHHRGVIHRDIKPANIMVTLEGVVKVVDFGIARLADAAKTQTGSLLGTLCYMSPEQLRGQRADQRSDVWSLGTVMYELLTYRRAFDGENHAAVMMSILQDEPLGIEECIPECPANLERVVQRALHKDEGHRYQTMEALLVDLEPICNSLQRESVRKLVSQGRQLMEIGKLAEAGEVLRQTLAIDTSNLTAKTLFDQVNALLGSARTLQLDRTQADPKKFRETEPASQVKGSVADHGRDGAPTTVAIRDPQLTICEGPRTERREKPGSTGAGPSSGQAKKQQAASPVTTPTRELQTVRQTSVAAGQLSATPRPAMPPSRVSSGSRAVNLPIERAPKKRTTAYAIGAVVLAVTLAAFGYLRLSLLHKSGEILSVSPLASGPATASQTPTAQPAKSNLAPDPAPSAQALTPVSTEDQQRHLIDLAHEAADSRDYRTAQARLDEAARLNGPLNSLIVDLRRRFSGEAHGAQLQESARKEQSLWDKAMKELQGGRLDDADRSLREILTLQEGGRRLADAERYVDQVIPQERRQEELWAQIQTESNSNETGHLINEVKTLDQLLAGGGVHEQDARQLRDAVMIQFARNNARRNHEALPVVSSADESRFSQLEDQFVACVQRGDAQALEQLQNLRPQFKSIAEGRGPMAINARDIQNNLLPKAQKEIEDRLANAESAGAANGAYEAAMKHFDRAVATQNTAVLHSHVLPEFQQIVAAGGPRAPEAARYVNILIPAALKAGATH
jgi:tetratricopeptide (TPR) repeat protein/predicted Ser/Thr protein kinase